MHWIESSCGVERDPRLVDIHTGAMPLISYTTSDGLGKSWFFNDDVSFISQRHISDDQYDETLGKLLQLAPKPKHPVPFSTSKCQTILMTHCPPQEDSNPWPASHEAMLYSRQSQQLLLVEIASGNPSLQPQIIHKNDTVILIPGSLLQRGEFCFLDLILVPDGDTFRWQFDKADLLSIND